MNCQQCSEHLSAYLDGLLSASERQALESHCAGCARCAAELADLQKILIALPQLPQPPVPENFRRRVWSEIDRKGRPLDSWLIKLPVGALATAAVILLVARVSQDTMPQMKEQAVLSDVAAARFAEPTMRQQKAAPLAEQEESVSAKVINQDKNKMELKDKADRSEETLGKSQSVSAAASPQLAPQQNRASMKMLETEDGELVSGRKMSADSSSAASLVADGLEDKKSSFDSAYGESERWFLRVEDPSATQVLVRHILQEMNAFNIRSISPYITEFQVSFGQRDSLKQYLNELGDLQQVSSEDSTIETITIIVLQRTS